MSAPPPPGGAAVGALVGHLDTLPPLGELSVRALRRWCDAGTEALARDLGLTLGEDGGEEAASALDALFRQGLAASRRPLMRHDRGCPCLGADEAVLAALVQAATEGEREDALLLACLLVRPDLAPRLVHLAQAAGLALARGLAARRLRRVLH